MQDDLQEQTRSRAAAQTKRKKWRVWVAGLCCAVAAATAYALTRPALTMTQQTFCGQEAHTHSLSCYADAQADLESASVWEQTIPQTLSGQWRADVVAVAESQLGYAASTRNYIVDEAGGMHGYTRYGAWYGSPYGEWCAMFASFCLHYAGVPEDSIPAQADCIR